MEIRAQYSNWYDGLEIAIFERLGDCRVSVAEPITMTVKDDPLQKIKPVVTLERKEAQLLFNDLWQSGFRPTDGTGSAGQLQATENHLEDMKTIVFHALKINKGQS